MSEPLLNELRLRVVCFSIPKINLFQTSDSRNVSYKSLITFGYKARLVTIATASPYELHSPTDNFKSQVLWRDFYREMFYVVFSRAFPFYYFSLKNILI